MNLIIFGIISVICIVNIMGGSKASRMQEHAHIQWLGIFEEWIHCQMNWFRTATLTSCIAEWAESAKGSLALHNSPLDDLSCTPRALWGGDGRDGVKGEGRDGEEDGEGEMASRHSLPRGGYSPLRPTPSSNSK